MVVLLSVGWGRMADPGMCSPGTDAKESSHRQLKRCRTWSVPARINNPNPPATWMLPLIRAPTTPEPWFWEENSSNRQSWSEPDIIH